MNKMYSNADDCIELASYLKKKMGNEIDFLGSIHQEVISGKYFSHFRDPHSELDYLLERGLPFYYKFCKEGFLRIGIGSSCSHKDSLGEKLAALSRFYVVLREQYGEPIVFYTIKGDEESTLTLQWSFINKEEEIQSFKNGNYFDDAEIDELIVFGEPEIRINGCPISEATRQFITRQIGLPVEMINLTDRNIEEFLKYRRGEEFTSPEEKKNYGPSFKKKISSGAPSENE